MSSSSSPGSFVVLMMTLQVMAWTSLRSCFSCRRYSFSMLTWKYCVGFLVVYFGDFVLGLLARGVSGERAGVVGFLMYGDGVSCAVFDGLVTVMISGVLISSVCRAGGEVSFGAVGSRFCRRRSGRRWTPSSCGLARPLASRRCRLPPAFGLLL